MSEEEVVAIIMDPTLTIQDKARRIVDLHEAVVQNAVWEAEMGDDL